MTTIQKFPKENASFTFTQQMRVLRRYASDSIRLVFSNIISEKLDNFSHKRLEREQSIGKTRGNVTQRVSGIVKSTSYQELLNDGLDGHKQINKELNECDNRN